MIWWFTGLILCLWVVTVLLLMRALSARWDAEEMVVRLLRTIETLNVGSKPK